MSQLRVALSKYIILVLGLLVFSGKHDILRHLRCRIVTYGCRRQDYTLPNQYCYQRPLSMRDKSSSRLAHLKSFE